MSTRQEAGVIHVKYQCHKATRTLNVTQKSSLADTSVVPDGLKIVPYLCIARDCFMILILRSFQFNALSRGNQHPICLIKRLDKTYLGGFSLHQLLPETLPLCYWNLRFWTSTFFEQQFIFYKCLFRTNSNVTPSANKSRSYLHLIVSCCGLEFQFLSVPPHYRLPSRSTRFTFYVPNPPSPLEYNTAPSLPSIKISVFRLAGELNERILLTK